MTLIGKEGLVFELFSINLVKIRNEYQVARIKVYAPTAKRRIEISKEAIFDRVVLGMPETVETNAKSHRQAMSDNR